MKKSNTIIIQVKKYIDENITKDLSLTCISKKFGLNKHYLCHLFKKNTGYTLLQYIKRKRFSLIHNYCEEGMSLLDAAIAVGFRNYSNFYKAWRNEFGKAPSKSL